MIIGISGYTYTPQGEVGSAGAGKDTVGTFLSAAFAWIGWETALIALADPIKRIVKEVFDFSDDALWGSSEKRNEPDTRYIRLQPGELGTLNGAPNPTEVMYLTARHSTQTLGTEWGRENCPTTWVLLGLRYAALLLGDPGYMYDRKRGLTRPEERAQQLMAWREEKRSPPFPPRAVLFTDVRFPNEVRAIQEAGGRVLRVRRPLEELSVKGGHLSEIALAGFSDQEFDLVIQNTGDLAELGHKCREAVTTLTQRAQPLHADDDEDVPPFKRRLR